MGIQKRNAAEQDIMKFYRLYHAYSQPMYQIAFSILHEEALAEDAVCASFHRVLKCLGAIKEEDSKETRSFLFSLAATTAKAMAKRSGRADEPMEK